MFEAEVYVEELGEEVEILFTVGIVESGALSSGYEGLGIGDASCLPRL